MLSKIYSLLDYCYDDITVDDLPNIKLQLFLISAKSLIPYEDNIGCLLDENRYSKEIDLFKYYKNGQDNCLEYYIENKIQSNEDDNLIEFKIIPLIIANTNWENLLNEVLKLVLFYTTSKNTILNSIIVSSIINEYLTNTELNVEEIINITKQRVISFSLKEYFESNEIEFTKSNLIEFEKERIMIVGNSQLITDNILNQFKSVQYIINNVTDEKKEIINETVLSNFSSYLLKLRRGIINPEKLKIQLDNIPKFKEFLRYKSFSHPLLGKCMVVKRAEKEVILKSKSGLIKVNI